MTPNRVRVAAAQFAAGTDLEENLDTCLRMIDQAAPQRPDLLVLPEFCNHASWYEDAAHCYSVAVAVDGPFVQAVAARAARYGLYIVLNCTVQRDNQQVTGTNFLFGRDGQLLAQSDKQVLMGNENNFLTKATQVCPIIESEIGRLGLYSCMDGVIFETPRGLALRGAQILANSLNSFALDEASLHVPVRAAENKVFVVAANKVGWLVPQHLAEMIAERVQLRPEQLHGGGESQIVAPDGQVLAMAPLRGEAVIWADIDPRQADNKLRPDGTHIFQARRPDLYAPLAQPPTSVEFPPAAEQVMASVFQPKRDDERALDELLNGLDELTDSAVMVLPELFGVPNGQVSDVAAAAAWGQRWVDRVQAELLARQLPLLVASSRVDVTNGAAYHVGVLVGADGVVLRQPQLHPVAQHAAWQTLITPPEIFTYDIDFGRVGLVVGDDAIYPELLRRLALAQVAVVMAPLTIREVWEVQTGLLERAAENRMNMVAASRPTPAGASMILALDEDFTLWTPWKKRPFDGNINVPIVTRAPHSPGLTHATIYPASAQNRMVSQKTDVVDGRPYWLLDALVR